MALNPYDYETRLGYGMCLDWLDRPKEATKYFVQALELNPNSARVQWKFAWHCAILRNYPLAKLWLERSLYWVPTPGGRRIPGNGERKAGGGQSRQPGRAIKQPDLAGSSRSDGSGRFGRRLQAFEMEPAGAKTGEKRPKKRF